MNRTTSNRKKDQTPVTQSYPRTGKRGVPQQFPRRLYTMLDSESNHNEEATSQAGKDCEPVIQWSESGQAFRIIDTDKFSNDVLPKYFRTSKFSSFQRNLNLYGFSKVRKGPDTDMYAHPSFLQGHPELLSLLKKCKHGSTSDKKVKDNVVIDHFTAKAVTQERVIEKSVNQQLVDSNAFHLLSANKVGSIEPDMIHHQRVVSPCNSNSTMGSFSSSHVPSLYNGFNTSFDVTSNISTCTNDSGASLTFAKSRQVSSSSNESWNKNENVHINSPKTGKLGLLALAMECLADRDMTSSA
jgi:hypothetical protein